MSLIGKTTINPILFYSGKISGYITWILLSLPPLGFNIFESVSFDYNIHISLAILSIAIGFVIISLINLGKSTRLGIPTEDTVLKTRGVYRISRNPMYLGFNLLTLSSMIFFLNIWIILLGIYSIIIYHFIILAEEKFLKVRFGENFDNYMKKTRRYI